MFRTPWVVRALLIGAIVLLGGTPMHAQEVRADLSAAVHDAVRLAPDAPTATATFQVSDATGVVFDSVATAPGIVVTLVAPNGSRYNESNIGGIGGVAERQSIPAVARTLISPTETPGDHVTFTIPNPFPGTWAIEFGAPAGNASEIAVAVSMILNSPSAVALIALPEKIVLGQAAGLTLAAFSSTQPIVGSAVAVQILAPSGAVSNLVLTDNGVLPDRAFGDGLYAGAFVPSEAGSFQALATLTGVSPMGASIVRQASATFDVVPPTLALLGSVRTRTIDLNSNGLIDELVLDVGVSVLQPGDFVVQVVLTASNGASLVSKGHFRLSTADAVVQVTFTAEDVRRLGVNGPYTIGPVDITFLAPTGAQPADRVNDAGQTPAFSLADFERPLIEFAGTSRDTGIDLDGDGLFDRLDVELDMAFSTPGFYQWSAILFDPSGVQIGFASGTGTNSGGTAPISLSFDGRPIGANGADGPYVIGNLLVSGSGASLLLTTVATTSAFRASEFEGFTPRNKPPVADAGPDQVVEASSQTTTPVTLDGSASSDPDGDALTFSWTDADGVVIGTTASVQVAIPLGSHDFRLSVSDGKGGTSSDEVRVMVRDTTRPALSLPADVTTPALRSSGAPVVFTATAVDSVDGLLLVTCTPASGSTFAIDATAVTCVAVDNSGNSSMGQFTVTVTNDPTPGRMHGEGHVDQGGLRYVFDFEVRERADGAHRGDLRVTICRPGRDRHDRHDRSNGHNDDDDCRDGGDDRGRDDDRWRDNDHKGDRHRNRFEADRFSFVRFSNDLAFKSGRHEQKRPDTLVFAGTGRWERREGYFFEVLATDRGEPGRGRDTFELVIKAPDGQVVASVNLAPIDAGNVQATPPWRDRDDDHDHHSHDDDGDDRHR